MTCGIYKLSFNSNINNIYIGQSINIEKRLKQHLALFHSNKASKKLQEAFNAYGPPTLELVQECVVENLNNLEEYYISKFDTVKEGLNTRSTPCGGTSLWGESNGHSKYSNDQIVDCLFFLISSPKLTYPIISSRTGVNRGTIVDIANGTGHSWLREYFPEEYSLLMSFRHRRNTKEYMRAVSPDGTIYEVSHLTQFCKEHNLETGNMSRLLRGIGKRYGKWTAIP